MSNLKEIRKPPVRPIVVGQIWEVVDPTYARAPQVEVVAIGEPWRRVFPGSKVAVVQDVSIRNLASGRTTRARSDRFDGKRNNYAFVRDGVSA